MRSSGNKLEGNFKIATHGFVNDDLKWQYFRSSKADFQQFCQGQLEDIFHTKNIDSVQCYFNADSINIQGHISYVNKYYQSGNFIYLFIDDIPTLISNYYTTSKIENEEYIGSTILKKFTMNITLDKPIRNVEFKPLKEPNYPLNFKVCKSGENSLMVNYTFRYNKIWINSGDQDSMNRIIDNFNSKIHEAIIIHL